MEIPEALATTELFRGLDQELLAELARLGRLRRFRRGAVVWRHGDPADALLVLVQGRLKVSRLGANGRELVLHDHVPGESLGEPGLFISDGCRFSECQAVAPSACFSIERAALLGFYTRHPGSVLPMLERLSEMLKLRLDTAIEVAFSRLEERLARALIHLAEVHGEPAAGGVRIALRIPQSTLAGFIGSSRERVNQLLRQFAASGLLRNVRGALTLLDLDGLQRCADGER